MAKFTVRVKEIHESLIEVEADNPAEALEMAAEKLEVGDWPEDFHTEYQRTLDKHDWIVEDDKGRVVLD